MSRPRTTPAPIILLLGLALAACSAAPVPAEDEPAVTVEAIDGSELHRITVSARAATRLAIETAEVTEEPMEGGMTIVVPHAAVFWDAAGQAWTYTNPEQRVFVRAAVSVARIDGDTAILSDGPAAGTPIVVVGAAELWGAETGVGGGH